MNAITTHPEPANHAEPPLRQLIDQMRQRIGLGRVPPGAQLREQELIKEFAISRMRARELLFALQERGLVERRPNHSAYVRPIRAEDVLEIYAVRENLEGLCMRLAVQNEPPQSWQDLIDFFDEEMASHLRSGDLDAYVAGLVVFRQRLSVAARNTVLVQMIDGLYDRIQIITHRTIVLPGRAEASFREIGAVLEAMRRGDPREAERLRKEHIRSQRDCFLRFQGIVAP